MRHHDLNRVSSLRSRSVSNVYFRWVPQSSKPHYEHYGESCKPDRASTSHPYSDKVRRFPQLRCPRTCYKPLPSRWIELSQDDEDAEYHAEPQLTQTIEP
jgi:hypothetical protein